MDTAIDRATQMESFVNAAANLFFWISWLLCGLMGDAIPDLKIPVAFIPIKKNQPPACSLGSPWFTSEQDQHKPTAMGASFEIWTSD
jgi:hypothetical protein